MFPDDPVIQRIREARHLIQKECGDDIHAMLVWATEEQQKYADRLVNWENPGKVLDLPAEGPAKEPTATQPQ